MEFLLDQRSERRMRIGGVDVAVSQGNTKRFHRNSSQKRARVEVAPIENIDNLITSSENESSSQSPSEFEQSSEIEEECAGPSHLVSSDLCKLTDKKIVSLRSASSILQDLVFILRSVFQISNNPSLTYVTFQQACSSDIVGL